MQALIPAAQYQRMSTEQQMYSLANQGAAIAAYAQEHGFEIIKTYCDAGKSGITTKGRNGLKSLLADVLSGAARFNTILVLDLSRWGRFQDPDEAPHNLPPVRQRSSSPRRDCRPVEQVGHDLEGRRQLEQGQSPQGSHLRLGWRRAGLQQDARDPWKN
jgi:hypothetical protein